MNLFTVLIPYLFAIAAICLLKPSGLIVRFVASKANSLITGRSKMGAGQADNSPNGNHNSTKWITVSRFFISGLFFLLLIYIFIVINQYFIGPIPSKNYKLALKQAEVVVAFGFGIEKDQNGNLKAGQANDSIMSWIGKNTAAKYIIAQKGCEISEFGKKDARIIEMHTHSDNIYVNTFDAADSALNKLNMLFDTVKTENKQVIVVAHDMQLQRAFWILGRINQSHSNPVSCDFIMPSIPSMPFSSNSAHIQTRNKLLYTLVELYISRPRDYFHFLFSY